MSYLYAGFSMLSGTKEECAIDKWISIKHQQLFLAKNTMYLGSTLWSQSRQNEASGFVVAVIAFIFGLKQKMIRSVLELLNISMNTNFQLILGTF